MERPGYAPTAPDQPTKEQVWQIDDLKKLHPESSRCVGRQSPDPFWITCSPARNTIRLLTRLPHDTPVPSNITKRMSLYDDAEQHQGVSDIYVVVAGGATMVAGGEIEDRQYRPTEGPNPVLLLGEFVGQPIVGGRTYKLKPGDMVNIPPDLPHQLQPDPGGITYMLVKINVGLYPWGQAREFPEGQSFMKPRIAASIVLGVIAAISCRRSLGGCSSRSPNL